MYKRNIYCVDVAWTGPTARPNPSRIALGRPYGHAAYGSRYESVSPFIPLLPLVGV
jgi:hypothetical protein